MWSSGPRSVGCTSSRAPRSARSVAGRGSIATRSAGRSTAASRRFIGVRRRGRSSIRSRTRATGCCARSQAAGSPSPRAARAARLHGVQDRRRRLLAGGPAAVRTGGEDVSADGLSAGRHRPVRCVAPARGDPGRAMARRAAAGRSWRALASAARAPACWSSRRRPRSAGRDRRLPAAPRWPPADAGVGPPCRNPRP